MFFEAIFVRNSAILDSKGVSSECILASAEHSKSTSNPYRLNQYSNIRRILSLIWSIHFLCVATCWDVAYPSGTYQNSFDNTSTTFSGVVKFLYDIINASM